MVEHRSLLRTCGPSCKQHSECRQLYINGKRLQKLIVKHKEYEVNYFVRAEFEDGEVISKFICNESGVHAELAAPIENRHNAIHSLIVLRYEATCRGGETSTDDRHVLKSTLASFQIEVQSITVSRVNSDNFSDVLKKSIDSKPTLIYLLTAGACPCALLTTFTEHCANAMVNYKVANDISKECAYEAYVISQLKKTYSYPIDVMYLISTYLRDPLAFRLTCADSDCGALCALKENPSFHDTLSEKVERIAKDLDPINRQKATVIRFVSQYKKLTSSVITFCASYGLLNLLALSIETRPQGVVRNAIITGLPGACARGMLETVLMAVERLQLTQADIRRDSCKMLRMACARGRLEVVQYLYETFALTLDDIRAEHNYALGEACSGGHMGVVRYICELGLTSEDVRSDGNYAFCAASTGGHLEVVQYLHSRYRISRSDATTSSNYPLRFSCQNGHSNVVEWLAETFELKFEDIVMCEHFALRMAIANGHVRVYEWLLAFYTPHVAPRKEAFRSFFEKGLPTYVNMAMQLLGLGPEMFSDAERFDVIMSFVGKKDYCSFLRAFEAAFGPPNLPTVLEKAISSGMSASLPMLLTICPLTFKQREGVLAKAIDKGHPETLKAYVDFMVPRHRNEILEKLYATCAVGSMLKATKVLATSLTLSPEEARKAHRIARDTNNASTESWLYDKYRFTFYPLNSWPLPAP